MDRLCTLQGEATKQVNQAKQRHALLLQETAAEKLLLKLCSSSSDDRQRSAAALALIQLQGTADGLAV